MQCGSCICNILVVIGIASIIKPVKVDKKALNGLIPIEMIAIVLLLLLANINSSGEYSVINRWQGVLLIIFAVGYIIYTIYAENKAKNDEYDKEVIEEVKSKESTMSIWTTIVFIIVGILALKYGSDFVVDNAVSIAEKIGLSEQFIGVTIVAIGTTLPEIITGIVAARKDASDLLIGNVIGSNILNLCLLSGIGSIISPLLYQTSFNASIVFLLVITMFLQLRIAKSNDNRIDRKNGILMLIVYVFYIIFMMK